MPSWSVTARQHPASPPSTSWSTRSWTTSLIDPLLGWIWVVDNGSSHRGRASVERLQRQWPNIEVVHLPIHASWLNQIEIYFSIVQRKVLTPNDFPDLQTLEAQLFKFQDRYQRMAQPFEWRFTRADLARLLSRLNAGDTLQLSA